MDRKKYFHNQMRYSTLLLLQLMSYCGSSQNMTFDYDSRRIIQLSISDEKIVYQESGFDLNLLFTNKTDTAFILYGLNDVEKGWWEGRSTYMEPENAMGSALFVIDANGKQLDFQIANDLLDKYAGHKPIPRDSIQDRAQKGKIIVPAKGSVDYLIKIVPKLKPDGEKYILPKGEHTIMFFYFSGHNIFNVLPEEIIESDEEMFNAKMYQGYIMSNAVKFIVRYPRPLPVFFTGNLEVDDRFLSLLGEEHQHGREPQNGRSKLSTYGNEN